MPVEVLSQTSHSNSHSNTYASLHQSDGLAMQSEIYLPQGQGVVTDDDDDDLESVAIDMWKKEGFQNPGYIPDDKVSTGKSDTDNESGVHGEYNVTMDDIISRGDDLELAHSSVEMSKVTSMKQQKLKNKDHKEEAGGQREAFSNSSEDEAVFIKKPLNLDVHGFSDIGSEDDRSLSQSDVSQRFSKSSSPAPEKPKRSKLYSQTLQTESKTETVHFKDMIEELDDCYSHSDESCCASYRKDSDLTASASPHSSVPPSESCDITKDHGMEDDDGNDDACNRALHQFICSIPPPPNEPAPEPSVEKSQQTSLKSSFHSHKGEVLRNCFVIMRYLVMVSSLMSHNLGITIYSND